MKKFYRISINRFNSPVLLVGSILMALYVMLFINGFMGSLGGIPACVGFFCVVYLLRGMVDRGNSLSHHLAMTSDKEIYYLFLNYSIGYFLIWGVMRIVQVVARITGWGVIEGMSVYTYFHNLVGTSVYERWAYIFTAILMFSYVMSLFPVVVIHKKRIIALYFAIDSVIYIVLCWGLRLICRVFIRDELEGRAKCVLDDLLLCELPKVWEAACYMIFVVLLTVGMSYVAIRIAIRFHGPKPGKMKVDTNRFPVFEGNEEDFAKAYERLQKRHKLARGISIVVAAAAVVAVGIYLFSPQTSAPGYKKVAECLTSDSSLGPFQYNGDLYLPISEKVNNHKTGYAIGYLGYKGQNCDSRFYRLAIANLLYKKSGNTALELYGDDVGYFELADKVLASDSWKEDEVFFLWDEDSSHSNASGYSILSREYVMKLREHFTDLKLNASDFEDYEAYFTIQGYKDANSVLKENVTVGDWAGCIFVKENQFYFCNSKNAIEDELLEELMLIVGGNTNGGNPTTETTETEETEAQ